jgi:hypothetical protein
VGVVLAVSLAAQPQLAVLVLYLVQYQPLAEVLVLGLLITVQQVDQVAVGEYLVVGLLILGVLVFLAKVMLAELTLSNLVLALRAGVVVLELLV